MSEWLGLISIKEYLTRGCNEVLEATSQSQLMEISYDDRPIATHTDPVWLRRLY
jgi:hypothetical protein